MRELVKLRRPGPSPVFGVRRYSFGAGPVKSATIRAKLWSNYHISASC